VTELRSKRIVVVGAGNMGGALVGGLVESGIVPASAVTAVDVVPELVNGLKERHGVQGTADAASAVAEADIIVLAVKPQVWEQVAAPFANKVTPSQLVISIMAGVRTGALEAPFVDGVPVVRVMPNILALVRSAVSALCAGPSATEDHLATAEAVLGAVGDTVRVDEGQMDAVTGLSGSGPAYVYMIIDALADGGVKAGLPKPIAMKLAVGTVLGAAKMVMETGMHPAELKDRVTSPGGTTIAGLQAMENGGVRAALMAAVEAAARRPAELGEG
jgi:pyrroline-5-carboxylate reductase